MLTKSGVNGSFDRDQYTAEFVRLWVWRVAVTGWLPPVAPDEERYLTEATKWSPILRHERLHPKDDQRAIVRKALEWQISAMHLGRTDIAYEVALATKFFITGRRGPLKELELQLLAAGWRV